MHSKAITSNSYLYIAIVTVKLHFIGIEIKRGRNMGSYRFKYYEISGNRNVLLRIVMVVG